MTIHRTIHRTMASLVQTIQMTGGMIRLMSELHVFELIVARRVMLMSAGIRRTVGRLDGWLVLQDDVVLVLRYTSASRWIQVATWCAMIHRIVVHIMVCIIMVVYWHTAVRCTMAQNTVGRRQTVVS